jgi:hypothetical protein
LAEGVALLLQMEGLVVLVQAVTKLLTMAFMAISIICGFIPLLVQDSAL